jgi:hypothetical protein
MKSITLSHIIPGILLRIGLYFSSISSGTNTFGNLNLKLLFLPDKKDI